MSEAGAETKKPRVLVYYFAFPHYRKSILAELVDTQDVEVELRSGSVSRGGVKCLTAADIAELEVADSLRLGPFTYERHTVGRAISAEYHSVIVAPALSSLSTWAIVLLRFILRRRTYLWGDCGHLQGWLRPRLQEVMNRMSSGLLVYGEASAKGAQRFGTPPRKISIVHNANQSNADRWDTDSSRAAYRRTVENVQLAKEEGRIVLVHAGRLTPDKRPEVLLDALTPLRSRYSGVELHILGDGPSLEALTMHANSDLVSFHGAIYDELVKSKILSEATLVVAPYAMGLLAVDALRAGVPVLLPDNPMSGSEVEILTPRINAVTFEAGNPEALAAAVDEWLATSKEITEGEFVKARQEALMEWDSGAVAHAIIRDVLK